MQKTPGHIINSLEVFYKCSKFIYTFVFLQLSINNRKFAFDYFSLITFSYTSSNIYFFISSSLKIRGIIVSTLKCFALYVLWFPSNTLNYFSLILIYIKPMIIHIIFKFIGYIFLFNTHIRMHIHKTSINITY